MWDGLFFWYSTIRPISCSCLHRHWLKWELHPVITESGNTLFIAQTTVASKSYFIISGDQDDHQFFERAVEVECYRVWTTQGYCPHFCTVGIQPCKYLLYSFVFYPPPPPPAPQWHKITWVRAPSLSRLHIHTHLDTPHSVAVAYRGGVWGVQILPPKFRRYRWSPRSHEQEELASRFPFVVHCVLIRL